MQASTTTVCQPGIGFYMAGMACQVAVSPVALVANGGDTWNCPPHWSDDALAAVTDAWPQSIGVTFDTGGAALLECLGEGVYQVAESFREGDPDLPLKFQALLMFAFCATDCRRLLMAAQQQSEVEVAQSFGLYRYGQQQIQAEPEPYTVHYLAADVDEWAAFIGHSVFHVEARRFFNEDKALRVIARWARHSGDTSALDFSYLQEVDPAHWRVDVAQVNAVRAGFQWAYNAAHWIEHASDCGVPTGARVCSCSPLIGFTNGNQTATVKTDGEVTFATSH